ncbi:ABC transporter ATP-binding protein/permease [Acidobacteria bacterium AH-259-O06]|nr:ABC transporter ATP-binding protein/permease [Acidobacteria bacterium AH-259-O06]
MDPRKQHLLSLIPYLRKYKRPIVIGALMVLLTNIAAVISPWILRNAIDHLYVEISRDILLYYSVLIIAVSLVEGLFRFLMRRILIGVSRNIEYDLRNDLFAHLQSLSPTFYQRSTTGDIMSRATNDLSAVRMVLGPGIMYSINTLFIALLTIGILVRIDARLAILTLTPLLVVSYCVKYFGKQIHQRFEKIQEQFAAITTLAQENVSGIRVVKAYNQEKAFVLRFQQANDVYLSRSLSLIRIWGMFSPLLSFLLGLSSVGLLWYGGHQVIEGSITLGDFVAFMAYLAMLTWPTIALGWVINIFERGSASMGRINQILHSQPEIRDERPLPVSELRGNVQVNNLTFSYNGVAVLKNIDFEVRSGHTLAIVGNTGSGKSTLVNLLCRLYRVPRASIFIDGIDINDIPLQSLRKSIGYVPQETFLFSEKIGENIAFGKPDADFRSIEEASKISNVWPDIQDFPRKFETFVGERGVTLSGGQKQRIAISRALLINPRILILDDALSSVDTHTEEKILKRLSREISDRTVILISHRISTIKMADQILVMENGEIVERGTHEDLLNAEGHYANLYEKQLLKEELGVE